ncbi:MarC family protein [Flavobacterium branchiicola]|uniref:UPF0056 membrane protein n=1 Tax=Flavobacterium branchiicola TaxID=1114875 RepID=A0ABV9PDC1_9FLAO|nr:MarC family protein [Flavobacterium branchiicola]
MGIIALFPVVNPFGSAFLISPYLKNLSKSQKKNAVRKITIYTFCFCVSILFMGPFILQAFGISISIIQLGGGIMICKIGWEFLNSDEQQRSENTLKENITQINISDKLFYPITFPVTAGAGTISVLFTLSAHAGSMVNKSSYYLHLVAILISITFLCGLVYVCYMNIRRVLDFLGPNGGDVVKRIFAFLVFCVGLQIAFTGLLVLLKI